MTRLDQSQRRRITLAAAAAALACLVVALLPTVERRVAPEAGWARLAFRPACHQIPGRCLDLGDGPLPVCARCFGLYLGGLTGLVVTAAASRRLRPRPIWILVAAAPSAVDFAAGFTGLPTLPNWPRFLVAMPPALLVGLLLADALAELGAGSTAPPDRIV